MRVRAGEGDDAGPGDAPDEAASAVPVMLAYVERGERCTYHNEAFRRGLGLRAGDIEGRALRAVLAETPYAPVCERIAEALSGKLIHYRSAQPAAEGSAEAYVHLVPRFDGAGDVVGLYTIVVDETVCRRRDARPRLERVDLAEGVQALYATRADDSPERRAAAGRVRAAIRGNEFRLFRQSIRDLRTGEVSFHGIFVRQAEEEEIRLPPGTFLALTESFGLQGELDRWVVRRVLEHAAQQRCQGLAPCMYGVSLSRDSISHPYFPAFVRDALASTGVAAESLCLELQQDDVKALRADSAELARQLRNIGARVVLGGFGRDGSPLELLRDMPVDFVKIDGSIIYNVTRSEAALGRLKTIVRVAHGVGINTIAELVESDHLATQLRELDVDYAQGVGVSPAMPLFGLPQ